VELTVDVTLRANLLCAVLHEAEGVRTGGGERDVEIRDRGGRASGEGAVAVDFFFAVSLGAR
jgi:hypothetical protein